MSDVSATVTFDNGRTATITDVSREAVQATIARLEQENINAPSLESDTPDTDRSKWGKNNVADDMLEVRNDVIDFGKDVVAAGDVGLTMATGAVSSITVAAAGAIDMLFGADPMKTAETVEKYSQAGTWMPHTERGQQLLEDIAGPLMELEETATDVSWDMARGNPYVATLIKTTMLGAAELAMPTKGSLKALKTGRQMRKAAKDMKQLAIDLGVNIDQTNLAGSIVDMAKRMTPTERAQHMPYLRSQMVEASNASKMRRNQAYDAAHRSKTYMDADSASEFGLALENHLEYNQHFVLKDMPKVRDRLGEIAAMQVDETGTRVNLSEWDNIRKRVNRNRSADPTENAALNAINTEMGKFLDVEFDRLALNQGSAISGEIAGVTAWKNARAASRQWHKDFNTDKTIVRLLEQDATAETYRAWIMGASSMNARTEAAATINRMKAVLGDNSPVIAGIRTDFLYEVAAPLLHPDGPNFKTFVRNYEIMVEKNPSLVKALDLKMGDFKELHDLSRLQKTLPADVDKARQIVKSATTIVSRMTVGHEIAKAGVKVNLARDIMNYFAGVDRVSQKQMLYELAGIKYGDILLEKKGPLAAQFIAGAALTEIADAQELTEEQ